MNSVLVSLCAHFGDETTDTCVAVRLVARSTVTVRRLWIQGYLITRLPRQSEHISEEGWWMQTQHSTHTLSISEYRDRSAQISELFVQCISTNSYRAGAWTYFGLPSVALVTETRIEFNFILTKKGLPLPPELF